MIGVYKYDVYKYDVYFHMGILFFDVYRYANIGSF